jgi:hypothetical protein
MNELLFPDEIISPSGSLEASAMPQSMLQMLTSANPIEAIRKALSIGYDVDPATMADGTAFRLESLEPDLKNLVFNEQSTAMANDLLSAKKTANSTVEQYTTINDVAEAFTYLEGGLPPQEDDDYSRRFEQIKYIGAVCQVTNVIQQAKNMVSAIEQENRMKLLAIKKKLNVLSYFGDKTLVSTEFNGFYKAVETFDSGSIVSTNIIDMHGYRPSLEKFNQGVQVIQSVSGYTDKLRLYMGINARYDYKNELLKEKRYMVTGDSPSQIQGVEANKLIYDGGMAPIRPDMFLNPRKFPRMAGGAFVVSGDTPPATPTVTSVTPTVDANSTLVPGTYDYAIVAVNKYGQKSVPSVVAATQNVAVNAGEKVVFVIADSGTSPAGAVATAFEVYRRDSTLTADTDYRYLFTAAIGTASDDGAWLPNTSCAFLIEWDTDQVCALHQLMDVMRFPLANVADSVRWLQRMYTALLVYNPKRVVVYKNIGSTPNP